MNKPRPTSQHSLLTEDEQNSPPTEKEFRRRERILWRQKHQNQPPSDTLLTKAIVVIGLASILVFAKHFLGGP